MAISIENISFSHGDRPILKHLNCQFTQGQFHSILGPNGSGKTTLLDVISGFTPPDQGEIKIGSQTAASLSKRALAQSMALVSQNYRVNFPFSVKEVVLMGRHPYIDRFAHPGKKDIDMADRVMEETGIAGMKDRKITELSGGKSSGAYLQGHCARRPPICSWTRPFPIWTSATPFTCWPF